MLIVKVLLEKRILSIFKPAYAFTLNGTWVTVLLLSVVLVEVGGTLSSNRGEDVAGQATTSLHYYSGIVALHKSTCTRRSIIAFLLHCNVMPILFSLLPSRIIYILLMTLFLFGAIDVSG